MPVFKYEALRKNGEKFKGTVDLPSEQEVRIFLRQQGARPLLVEAESLFNRDLSLFGSGVKDTEVAIMTRQLAVMVGSGVPLLQSFDILQQGEKNASLRKALKEISESISGGTPLWEAMSKQKKIFSHLYIYLVRAGELGGALDQILNRLAKYLDDSVRIVRMIKGAMVYPAIVLVVGFGVTFGLLAFVVPQFEQMIISSGGELPYVTQLVIQISKYTSSNALYIIAGAVVFGVVFGRWKASDTGRPIWDRFVLGMPVFGDLALKGATARFARTLGTMLMSGVNLIDAIEICKMTMDNVVVQDALSKVKEEITGGKTIAVPLAQAKLFPSMVVQMINVGENTGTLDQMLLKIADFYEAEVEAAVANMSKLIEPVVLVVLGGIVTFILIAMYMPIFNIAGSQQLGG
ncbi:MAG: type II secretion system F family protein [Bdellovibrionales bacterium]|nr:type II secretion system F family protein [Bdellovibrionales bacterium]